MCGANSNLYEQLRSLAPRGDLSKLSADQISALGDVLSKQSPASNQNISVHATQLPDDKLHRGPENWLEFKRSFANMPKAVGKWSASTEPELEGPLTSVGSYILEKNIRHPT